MILASVKRWPHLSHFSYFILPSCSTTLSFFSSSEIFTSGIRWGKMCISPRALRVERMSHKPSNKCHPVCLGGGAGCMRPAPLGTICLRPPLWNLALTSPMLHMATANGLHTANCNDILKKLDKVVAHNKLFSTTVQVLKIPLWPFSYSCPNFRG